MASASDHLANACAEEGEQGSLGGSWGQAALRVALLTGGGDPHYAFGLSESLVARDVVIDLIGSDEFETPAFRNRAGIQFLNLRGSVDPNVSVQAKSWRVLLYYARLVGYASRAQTRIFHILWNNKVEYFDRTLLMLYYHLLGKKIVLTAHNVNAGRRDGNDSWLNRLTLQMQYRLASHLFVHTEKMKRELIEEFHVKADRVTVIPFGINNAVPATDLSHGEARQRLGIRSDERVLLSIGRIVPYKGLEYLISAFRQLRAGDDRYRLIIAGRIENCEGYWKAVLEQMQEDLRSGAILLRDGFVPDSEIEVFCKAADTMVLPYRHIYQSGVLFMAHSFGLPVLASDVGSFREEIIEGRTGFIFRAQDPEDLVRAVKEYFASDLYANLGERRPQIQSEITGRHSWNRIGQMTRSVYAGLFSGKYPIKPETAEARNTSFTP
ncbi:MAG: glycosyltransferase family 4 protein [Candidatus Sulfotelmatobacter sp.]